jgi:alpha-methylacyl-CoA racemase
MAGPLAGLRVVELAGLGPGPFCGMMLADLGADVVCIERRAPQHDATDITARGKRRLQLDCRGGGHARPRWRLIAQRRRAGRRASVPA